MSAESPEPRLPWRRIYVAILVWLIVMIILMRVFSEAYA